MGVNNGGVWKTTDFGRTWKPIFDDQPTGSIGDVVVSPSNPDVIYVGSGENFGNPYTARGADGAEFKYLPGGANVFRIRRDGSKLEQYATGMWNAFVLTTDGAGRVFVCDNDPDSRPPCRFLHIVKGADFGYHFQYGRSGLHPFISWNGELPGTLPMMAGTGEAPTGILDARLAKLGPQRGDGFLMTEWGDSTLSWFRLKPQGASFNATREVMIRGDSSFRPACLAAAPDGSVYLTDWADREYSVHQKGRIWRIKATEPDKTPAEGRILPVTEPEQRRDDGHGHEQPGDQHPWDTLLLIAPAPPDRPHARLRARPSR